MFTFREFLSSGELSLLLTNSQHPRVYTRTERERERERTHTRTHVHKRTREILRPSKKLGAPRPWHRKLGTINVLNTNDRFSQWLSETEPRRIPRFQAYGIPAEVRTKGRLAVAPNSPRVFRRESWNFTRPSSSHVDATSRTSAGIFLLSFTPPRAIRDDYYSQCYWRGTCCILHRSIPRSRKEDDTDKCIASHFVRRRLRGDITGTCALATFLPLCECLCFCLTLEEDTPAQKFPKYSQI